MAQFDIFRLFASTAVTIGEYIAGIYTQRTLFNKGLTKRHINVCPSKEWSGRRGVLWKLKKLPHGIKEAGEQLATFLEGWLGRRATLHRVRGTSQLYIKACPRNLSVAKVTNDLLVTGTERNIKSFAKSIGERFPVRRFLINESVSFNGCHIRMSQDGFALLNMDAYLHKLQYIQFTTSRRIEI